VKTGCGVRCATADAGASAARSSNAARPRMASSPGPDPREAASGATEGRCRSPWRPNEIENRRSVPGGGFAVTTGVAGTTLVADTASAGTARDRAPAVGTMGVAAHKEAPLRPAARKQADFRLRRGSVPGGSSHWPRDRSTAGRACSERVAPGLMTAQRGGGANPAEEPRQEQRQAAPKGVVHLAGLAPGWTPQPQTMRQ
jgi:hypothetical protein